MAQNRVTITLAPTTAGAAAMAMRYARHGRRERRLGSETGTPALQTAVKFAEGAEVSARAPRMRWSMPVIILGNEIASRPHPRNSFPRARSIHVRRESVACADNVRPRSNDKYLPALAAVPTRIACVFRLHDWASRSTPNGVRGRQGIEAGPPNDDHRVTTFGNHLDQVPALAVRTQSLVRATGWTTGMCERATVVKAKSDPDCGGGSTRRWVGPASLGPSRFPTYSVGLARRGALQHRRRKGSWRDRPSDLPSPVDPRRLVGITRTRGRVGPVRGPPPEDVDGCHSRHAPLPSERRMALRRTKYSGVARALMKRRDRRIHLAGTARISEEHRRGPHPLAPLAAVELSSTRSMSRLPRSP
jgi:hypothetical protein